MWRPQAHDLLDHRPRHHSPHPWPPRSPHRTLRLRSPSPAPTGTARLVALTGACHSEPATLPSLSSSLPLKKREPGLHSVCLRGSRIPHTTLPTSQNRPRHSRSGHLLLSETLQTTSTCPNSPTPLAFLPYFHPNLPNSLSLEFLSSSSGVARLELAASAPPIGAGHPRIPKRELAWVPRDFCAGISRHQTQSHSADIEGVTLFDCSAPTSRAVPNEKNLGHVT